MNLHLHTEMWLHAMLAANHKKGHSWIEGELRRLYPEIQDFFPLGDKSDFGYILTLPDKVIIPISGTMGNAPAWLDNCRIIPENGIHRGWTDSWYGIMEPVRYVLKRTEKPVKLCGHSKGQAVSLRGALWLREELSYADVEQVGFCGPMLANRTGIARMKRAHVRSTRFWTDGFFTDPVDDVGVIGGRQYGYSIKLPRHPNIVPVMDHAYSNVNESLARLFDSWGWFRDAEFLIETAAKYATI